MRFSCTYRIGVLKLSVLVCREIQYEGKLSRVHPGSQICAWRPYQVEERDNNADRDYVNAETIAGETYYQDARGLRLFAVVDEESDRLSPNP